MTSPHPVIAVLDYQNTGILFRRTLLEEGLEAVIVELTFGRVRICRQELGAVTYGDSW